MKNMKIKTKLVVSFTILMALVVIVGMIGIFGMKSLSKADTAMYNDCVLAMDTLGSIRENYALQRMAYRNFLIYDGNSETFQSAVDKLQAYEADMDALIEEYSTHITSEEDRISFNQFASHYQNEFKDLKRQLEAQGRENQTEASKALLNSPTIIQLSASIDESMTTCYYLNVSYAKEAVDSNAAQARFSTMMQAAVILASVIASLFLTFYVSRLISKPLVMMTGYMQRVASTGDTTLSPADIQAVQQYSAFKDETGVCVAATAAFVDRILNVGKTLETIASGDLTVEPVLMSDADTMGLSLQKMVVNLNQMFGEINSAAIQVSSGSRQIADGAQNLAMGSTQQAAAIQQLSSSITEISAKTEDNAQMADRATVLAGTIKQNAEKGSTQMDQMLSAVQEIKEASQNIGKVIKVIDDIAFQTNILALNAAVEAARAGQHGKGFAVVAEEVRNLAAKSAEAAKNTSELITDSMDKAELGAHIAGETAVSLNEIVNGINDSSRIISDISTSSEEQTVAISQINKGIEQVASIIQQNSAASQESAAASDEMNSQSRVLERLMTQFKLKTQRTPFAPMKSPVFNLTKPSDKPSGEFCDNNSDKY